MACAKVADCNGKVILRELLSCVLTCVVLSPILVNSLISTTVASQIVCALEVDEDIVALDVIMCHVVGLDHLEGLENLAVNGQV